MIVKIPFKTEFQNVMLNGSKTMTSRTKKYGNVGDTFEIFGATFQLTQVRQQYLETVADWYFREEGFQTSNEFKECWNMLHPKKRFDPNQTVYTHKFERKEIEQE